MDNEEARKRMMMQLVPDDWDKTPLVVAHELAALIKQGMADQGTAVDSGGCNGSADLWFKVNGVEFYLTIRRSNNQLIKEDKMTAPRLDGPDKPELS